MRIIKCEQRTQHWYNVRLGVITASSVSRVTTKVKQKTYARELAAEKLTQLNKEVSVSDAMQWGMDIEEEVLIWYAFMRDKTVTKVGFCLHDDYDFGCSPDGLVDDDGLVEVKCPSSHNHLLYIEEGPPKNYIMQMQWQMYVTGRKWCDFVSYDPRMPPNKRGVVHRVKRNQNEIDALVKGAKEVLEMVERLTK